MVKFDEMIFNSASFGSLNPMPDIKNSKYIHSGFEFTKNLSKDETKYLGFGMIDTLIPYKVQDEYDRNIKSTKYKVVILENEYLRATFLPEFGGKLNSLYDKEQKRELLYVNSVIQPCNFALRNAWLSGGVEFNMGIKGHNPFTCSNMFTELIGDNAVRFYEFERIRGLSYSFTAILPKGSKTLYVRPRIENTSNKSRLTYWWSNIAFPETKDTRVIVPASKAIHALYRENHYTIDKIDIPYVDGVDTSYSLNVENSTDYFYRIPDNSRKWIVACDKNGDGLFHYSNSFLKTRKLFLWGKRKGGRHWNEFLSVKGEAYVEIQAGIMNTQLEHIPMPPNTVWEWTEGYTYIDGSNQKLHGNFNDAISEVDKYFDNKINSGETIAPENFDTLKVEGERKLVFNGSNWGAIENLARKKQGQNAVDNLVNYPLQVDDESSDFLHLLQKGYLPYHSVNEVPKAYINSEFYRDLMVKSLESSDGDHWFTYLQLAITEYALNNKEKAKEYFEKSIQKEPSLWAYRNLGFIYLNELNDVDNALLCFDKAYKTDIGKTTFAFIKEYMQVLINNNQDKRCYEIYHELDSDMQSRARIKLIYGYCLVHLNRPEEAKEIITPDFVLPDVKEGELSLSKLWEDTYTLLVMKNTNLSYEDAKKIALKENPVPYELDFRMHD